MPKRVILGVQITGRTEHVPEVQKVLTRYGCNIKTRLGLHEVSEKTCSTAGLLILETYGPAAQVSEMEQNLKKIPGIVTKKMVFAG